MYVFRAGFFLSIQSIWGCARLAWQGDNKRGALASRAEDGDRTAVGLDQRFGNRQPQPGFALVGFARSIAAVQPVKDVWQVSGGDARAGVLDGEVHGAGVLPGTR
jgi:hypothetical protein